MALIVWIVKSVHLKTPLINNYYYNKHCTHGLFNLNQTYFILYFIFQRFEQQ